MDVPRYVLNKQEGIDTLHRSPGESCNTEADEMEGRQRLDPTTGAALEKSGEIRLCRHCYGPDENKETA